MIFGSRMEEAYGQAIETHLTLVRRERLAGYQAIMAGLIQQVGTVSALSEAAPQFFTHSRVGFTKAELSLSI